MGVVGEGTEGGDFFVLVGRGLFRLIFFSIFLFLAFFFASSVLSDMSTARVSLTDVEVDDRTAELICLGVGGLRLL